MAKSIADKLRNSKLYKELNGDRELPHWAEEELNDFITKVGFSYDRLRTLSYWISINLTGWVDRFNQIKKLPNGSLEYQKLYHGDELGIEKYYAMSKAKSAHFDHSPEKQSERAKKAAAKLKGSSLYTIRSTTYWINKGFTEEQAIEKVKQIQSTNTKDRYVKTYGAEGEARFEQRKHLWRNKMSDPLIGKSRSLGLPRYIERYGESVGKQKYLEMRKHRNETSRLGKASNESVKVLAPILSLLDQFNIDYYIGLPGNREWFIFDENSNRPYFYDLTIPRFSIIVEYHGEGFHPNPNWDVTRWDQWRGAFTNITADEQHCIDSHKRQLAESKGWAVSEIYSSDTTQIQTIYNKLFSLANSSNSSGT